MYPISTIIHSIFFMNLNRKLNLKSNCISIRTINQNINMNNCLISIISSSENGGAISITSSYSLNINYTTFFLCISTSGNAGAIYFSLGLNISFYSICAFNCKSASGYYYQFSALHTKNNQKLDLISINNCSNLLGSRTVGFFYGNQTISNINISFNNNIQRSGIYYANPNSMFSNYCTFYNNTVSSFCCIYLQGKTGTISKSNIILNNSPNTNYGVVYVEDGNYCLNECIFDKNENIIIFVNSGILQLINCYYLTGSSSFSGLITDTLKFTKTNYQIHSIYFTFYCSYNILGNSPIHSKMIIKHPNFQIIYIISIIYITVISI